MKNYISLFLFFVLVTLNTNAQQWEQLGPAGFTQEGAYPTIVIDDSTGTPYMVDRGPGNAPKVFEFNGVSWMEVGGSGNAYGLAYVKSLAIYEGELYLAYNDFDNGNRATVKKYNGTSWEVVGSAGFTSESIQSMQIQVDNGVPYIAFRMDAGSIGTSVMKFDGTSWVYVGAPIFTPGGHDSEGFVVDDGVPYLAFKDAAQGDKITAMKFNGTSWELIGQAGFTDGSPLYSTSLSVSEGVPYIAYRDGTNGGHITAMKFNGTVWELVGNAGFSPESGTFVRIEIYNGTPYVMYVGAKVNVMRFDGGIWEPVGNSNFSIGGALYSSMAIAHDFVYVSYKDLSTQGGTVMRYDLRPPVGLTDNLTLEENVHVYPIPAQGTVFVKADMEILQLTVVDLAGRKVTVNFNEVNGALDVQTLASGTYYVLVETSIGSVSKELILLD